MKSAGVDTRRKQEAEQALSTAVASGGVQRHAARQRLHGAKIVKLSGQTRTKVPYPPDTQLLLWHASAGSQAFVAQSATRTLLSR